jgi:hypothetical protein
MVRSTSGPARPPAPPTTHLHCAVRLGRSSRLAPLMAPCHTPHFLQFHPAPPHAVCAAERHLRGRQRQQRHQGKILLLRQASLFPASKGPLAQGPSTRTAGSCSQPSIVAQQQLAGEGSWPSPWIPCRPAPNLPIYPMRPCLTVTCRAGRPCTCLRPASKSIRRTSPRPTRRCPGRPWPRRWLSVRAGGHGGRLAALCLPRWAPPHQATRLGPRLTCHSPHRRSASCCPTKPQREPVPSQPPADPTPPTPPRPQARPPCCGRTTPSSPWPKSAAAC